MRLDKYLSDMGVDARSDIKKNIRKGLVSLDGETVRDPGASVSEDAQVTYLGEDVTYAPFEYYMMNKPQGVISASEDKRQVTVLDLIKDRKRNDLYPVGRLDKDTEGLLLITNDGELTHRLLSPKRHVDKRYFARVEGRVTEKDVKKFKAGIRYDETLTALPAVLTILKSGAVSEVETTIQEGKFHQIKKMFSSLGMEVLYLKRLSMGPITLDPELKTGEYRRLTEEELETLKQTTGME